MADMKVAGGMIRLPVLQISQIPPCDDSRVFMTSQDVVHQTQHYRKEGKAERKDAQSAPDIKVRK